MSHSGPYPFLRPYYNGYNREEDEKLAQGLFYGTTVRDKKTGRNCHLYPPENSPQERQGVEALGRLLLCDCQDLSRDVLAGLLASLDLGGSFGRRLVFKPRKRKRPAGSATDLQIALCVQSLKRAGVKKAAEHAADKFHLTRKTVFEAMKRIRAESPWLKV